MTVTRVTIPRQISRNMIWRPAPGEPAGTHRRDIEGLRAIAVLLVVAYHAGVPLIGGGYVGVDVFFVISGYLITGLLMRELNRSGSISITGFYARRALRLLPAAVVVIAATVVAATRWLPPLRAPGIALDGLFTSLYSVNYRLAAAGADYLNADADPSPLQHFWSLAVEEQFYLVWPLLLLVFRRRPAPILSLLVALSLAVSVWQTTANPTWAYFGLHTRAWELGVGALIAVLALRPQRRTAQWLGIGGLIAITISAFLFTAETPFPGYAAALPVAGAAAVLAGGVTVPSVLLSQPPLQLIGKLSYSWYLWHWPFLTIGPEALGIKPGLKLNVALAAASLVAAALTYAFIENPVRRLPALRSRTRVTVAAGLAVTLLAAGAYYAGSRVEAPLATAYRAPVLTEFSPGALVVGAKTPSVPRNLTPALRKAGYDVDRLKPDGCLTDLTESDVKQPCAYGDTAAAETVVLFGDSHAAHWFAGLEQVAAQRHWRLVVVGKTACTASSVRIFHKTLNRPFDECVAWRKDALRSIESLHPSRVIFSSSTSGDNDLVDDSGAKIQDEARAAEVRQEGWSVTTDALRRTGAKLYFLADTPGQAARPIDCLSKHLRTPAACVNKREPALGQPERRAAVASTMRARGITVVDTTQWFCTERLCPVIAGNVLIFRDSSHMTATWSRLLSKPLSAALA